MIYPAETIGVVQVQDNFPRADIALFDVLEMSHNRKQISYNSRFRNLPTKLISDCVS